MMQRSTMMPNTPTNSGASTRIATQRFTPSLVVSTTV